MCPAAHPLVMISKALTREKPGPCHFLVLLKATSFQLICCGHNQRPLQIQNDCLFKIKDADKAGQFKYFANIIIYISQHNFVATCFCVLKNTQ